MDYEHKKKLRLREMDDKLRDESFKTIEAKATYKMMELMQIRQREEATNKIREEMRIKETQDQLKD
jgi:hypothetical protein